ncbi:MAG: hypothetical protein HQ559_00135 [Lentisphaerae bacterium]|nr:hypothetical protein [Lentisphaerota bacterium]
MKYPPLSRDVIRLCLSQPCLNKEGFHRFEACPEGAHGFWYRVGSGQFKAGDIRRFERPDEIELVTYQMWFTNHLRIRDVDLENRIVHFKTRGWHTLYDSDGKPCRYRLMNVKEALSEPGEVVSRRTFRGPDVPAHQFRGQTRRSAPSNVVAPRLETLVRLEGSQEPGGAKVEHVRFENLSFQHAEWHLPDGNPGASKAT